MSELKKYIYDELNSHGLPILNYHINKVLGKRVVKTIEDFQYEFATFKDFVVAVFELREKYKNRKPYTPGHFADTALRKYLESN